MLVWPNRLRGTFTYMPWRKNALLKKPNYADVVWGLSSQALIPRDHRCLDLAGWHRPVFRRQPVLRLLARYAGRVTGRPERVLRMALWWVRPAHLWRLESSQPHAPAEQADSVRNRALTAESWGSGLRGLGARR